MSKPRTTALLKSPESPDASLEAILNPLPEGWPKTGEYEGEPIDLYVARATFTKAQLAGVMVDVPGIGKHFPWKGSDIAIVNGKVMI